jgi:hypothetical protein
MIFKKTNNKLNYCQLMQFKDLKKFLIFLTKIKKNVLICILDVDLEDMKRILKIDF